MRFFLASEKKCLLFGVALFMFLVSGCASSGLKARAPYSKDYAYSSASYSDMEKEVFGSIENKRVTTRKEEYQSNGSEITHVVAKGDTLSGLSRIYGVSVKKIQRANNLRSNRIFLGEVLIIPGYSSSVQQQKVFDEIFDFSEEMTKYKIKKGDTLGKIAKRNGVSVRRICQINNIKNPNRLKIGQVILIPKG